MLEFLFLSLGLSVFLGGFFGLVATVNMRGIGRAIVATIIALMVGFSIGGIMHRHNIEKEERWNGGVCPKCGQEWTFANANHVKNQGTTYYWKCDNCQIIIEQ